MKSSSRSGGGSTTSDKHRSISQGTASDAAATARHSSSTTTKEKQPDNDRKRHHQQQRYQRIKQLKISPIPLNDCSFDSSNPQLVLHYDKFITEPLKYHRRLMVGHEHAFLMKDHQKLFHIMQ
uniref:Uncharacterized protein n=1 Tax=Panagrolaimus superbus TaxID=310955 RepID=A0A914XZQ1_9BILA